MPCTAAHLGMLTQWPIAVCRGLPPLVGKCVKCVPSLLAYLATILTMHFMFRCLLLWLTLGFGGPAVLASGLPPPPEQAATGRVDMAAFAVLIEDPQATLDIDAVRQRVASGEVNRAASSGVNLGYTRSVWWVAFQLPEHPAGQVPQARVVEVGFPTLDRIDYFAPNARVPLIVGDLYPFADRPVRHRHFAFDVPAGPADEGLVVLRVQSAGTLSVPLTVWSPRAWADYSRDTYAGFAVYFGALLALLVYNALLWSSIRERMYFDYVLFVAGLAVGLAGFNGLGMEYVWSGWPWFANLAFPLGFAVCSMGVAQFTRSFLSSKTVSRTLDRMLWLGSVLSFAVIPISVGLSYMFGGKLLTLATVYTTSMAVVAGVYCQHKRVASAPLFLMAWTLFMLFGIAFALRNYGLIPTNFVTLHGLQFGSLIGLLLLSFALANRIHTERRAKEAAQAEVLAAKQASIEALERSELALERRVADRTAELAAANQKLAASEWQQRELAHHDGLTGLANRLLLADRLDQALAKAQRDKRHFALLYLDLDRFKPVNDQHGHAVGDQLLKEVAARLMDAVRQSDTVARVGGDEFVIILHAVESDAAALSVANGIRASLSRAFHIDGLEIGIGCCIGVAVYPEHGADGATLSRRADEAMYQAKTQGRDKALLADV